MWGRWMEKNKHKTSPQWDMWWLHCCFTCCVDIKGVLGGWHWDAEPWLWVCFGDDAVFSLLNTEQQKAGHKLLNHGDRNHPWRSTYLSLLCCSNLDNMRTMMWYLVQQYFHLLERTEWWSHHTCIYEWIEWLYHNYNIELQYEKLVIWFCRKPMKYMLILSSSCIRNHGEVMGRWSQVYVL